MDNNAVLSHKNTVKKKVLKTVICGYYGSVATEGQGRTETDWSQRTIYSDIFLERIQVNKRGLTALGHSKGDTIAVKQGVCLGSNPN